MVADKLNDMLQAAQKQKRRSWLRGLRDETRVTAERKDGML
jgi:hypothetical protein